MTKTVRQWLETIPNEEDREKVIKYSEDSIGIEIDTEVESFDEALICAFIWDKTEEGPGYWHDLVKKMSK